MRPTIRTLFSRLTFLSFVTIAICCDERERAAIQKLHAAMDDDADGMVDLNESTDFLRNDLGYSEGSKNARQEAFHARGTDAQIDVNELWELWCESSVRNWTTDEMIEWLTEDVGFSQYADTFRENLINGTHLPQIAAESGYLGSLSITSYLHKIKLKTKAKDVVLFGPPQRNGYLSFNKLLIMIMISFASIFFAAYIFVQKRKSEQQYQMNLETIKNVERELVETLQQVSEENKHLSSRKCDLESQLQLHRQYSGSNLSSGSSGDLTATGSIEVAPEQLETISKLRSEVTRLEQALSSKKWLPSKRMLNLLAETYNRESWLLHEWKRNIEDQATKARHAVQKFEKRSTTMWGVYRNAQKVPADESKQLILDAKEAIISLQAKCKERDLRWQYIQEECKSSLSEQTIPME